MYHQTVNVNQTLPFKTLGSRWIKVPGNNVPGRILMFDIWKQWKQLLAIKINQVEDKTSGQSLLFGNNRKTFWLQDDLVPGRSLIFDNWNQ